MNPDGLPRRDVPLCFQNALLPGNIAPSCRRRRAVVGKSNRPSHQRDIAEAAATVLLSLGSVQQRAVSVMGTRRAGTPMNLTMASAAGLSDASAADLSRTIARSMTPLLPERRWTPSPDADQHLLSVVAEANQRTGGPYSRSQTPFAEPGFGRNHNIESLHAAALVSPQRPGHVVPVAMREQLVAESRPWVGSAANSGSAARFRSEVRTASRGGGFGDGPASSGMQRFLEGGSALDAPARTSPGIDPLQRPFTTAPKLRQELTDYHRTERITAGPEGSGMFASAGLRFDAATRANLGHGAYGVQDKQHRERVHAATVERMHQRTDHFRDVADRLDQRLAERTNANIAKRAELRERSAAVAAATSLREAKQKGLFESSR